MALDQAPGAFSGQFLASWTTGSLAAALAADAPIAAIRCGPTQTTVDTAGSLTGTRKIYITEIGIQLSITTAFTAIQQFGLYLGRFSAANMAGGVTVNPLRTLGNQASVALPGGAEGGDIRVSTTAALTTAGVTLDATAKPNVFGWSAVGPADYPRVILSFVESPIRLAPGEGIALFNSIVWPVAGVAIVSGHIKYDERFA